MTEGHIKVVKAKFMNSRITKALMVWYYLVTALCLLFLYASFLLADYVVYSIRMRQIWAEKEIVTDAEQYSFIVVCISYCLAALLMLFVGVAWIQIVANSISGLVWLTAILPIAAFLATRRRFETACAKLHKRRS